MKTRIISKPIVSNSRQGGAVLIVVISLLATLIVLGLFFFSWTSQELANARNFADDDPVEIDPTRVFDFGLRQVLVSVPEGRIHSALYANVDAATNPQPETYHSLLAHQIGPIYADGSPKHGTIGEGKGISVDGDLNDDGVLDSSDIPMGGSYPQFTIDYNADGTDEDTDRIILNYSVTSHENASNEPIPLSDPNYDFSPDVGHTYPGPNSLFLAMDRFIPDPDATSPPASPPLPPKRLIKPSFALPGFFPEQRYGGGFAGMYGSGGIPVDREQSLRPHAGHRSVVDLSSKSSVERYISTSTVANSGDRNRILEPFPMDGGEWGYWQDSTRYRLDKDLDGDGIDDSIAIDHDHPIIDLPDGRQAVPILYWKIIDMDGLFNANVHGNQSFAQQRSNASNANLYADVFQSPDWASYSHFGLSPSEVNLSIGLSADPQSGNYIAGGLRNYVTAPHRGYVAERHDGSGSISASDRSGGSGSITRLQMANIETAMMMYGRPEFIPNTLEYEGTSDIVGRYGTDGNLRLALEQGHLGVNAGVLPSPGDQRIDDNRNDLNGENNTFPHLTPPLLVSSNRKGGWAYLDHRLGVVVPPFVHPLDYSGLGDTSAVNGSRYNSSTGELILGGNSVASSPVRWPQYPSGSNWQSIGGRNSDVLDGKVSSSQYGDYDFRTYRDTNNLLPSTRGYLNNDPSEAHPYSSIPNTHDAMFSASEIAGLHLSQSDWNQSGMGSRLRELLPFNFEWNYQAESIRDRFTTESWDRTEFSMSPSTGDRSWEFNNNFKFPPSFNGFASTHELTDPTMPTSYVSPNIRVEDPFRPEVRRLLTIDSNPSVHVPNRKHFPQMRLQLNKILSDDALYSATLNPGHAAFDENGNPLFRNLVPHTLLSAGGTIAPMVHDHYTNGSLPPAHPLLNFDQFSADALVQEWWARYDRQRLARDIYVLLYTFGHGNDGFDPTTSVPPFTDGNGDGVDDFTYDCAQFAVNYVDAMDRDSVITRFEFDTNLSNGWQSSGLKTVYGVEEQSLSFSEVLCIETEAVNTNSDLTLFNNEIGMNMPMGMVTLPNGNHRFLYVELRNSSPFPVEIQDETWRIVRMTAAGVEQVSAAFQDGGQDRTIPTGENYLFACHDGAVQNGAGQPIGSEFYVDSVSEMATPPVLERVVPKGGTTPTVSNHNAVPVNVIDLDLNAVNHGNLPDATPETALDGDYLHVDILDTNYKGTTLVERSPTESTGVTMPSSFVLSLQRRQNLGARGTGEGVWLEIDRINVDVEFFGEVSSTADVLDELEEINSRERLHSFSRKDRDYPDGGVENHSMSVTAAEKNNANEFTGSVLPYRNHTDTEIKLWQPHFDRDMTSVADLLSVPLYGISEPVDAATYDDVLHGGTITNLVDDWRLTGHRTAQTRFLYPNPNDIPGNHADMVLDHAWEDNRPAYSNRWYRLLNFVEVDPVADDVVTYEHDYDAVDDDRLALNRRIPGRINLNTLRHEHVLAGLVDDDHHHNTSTGNPVHPTQDRFDSGRNWLYELLATRDLGFNPATNLAIRDAPGTPFARPFRALSDFNHNDPDHAIQNSILRRGGELSPGRLDEVSVFEARRHSDFNGPGGDDDLVDYHTRNRLLAKVANQTTTKSHVFAIWVGFDLHEAHTHSSGAVQIGARATDLPTYRQFLVVDMSRLEEAYNPQTGSFDFRKFIIHQQMLP